MKKLRRSRVDRPLISSPNSLPEQQIEHDKEEGRPLVLRLQ